MSIFTPLYQQCLNDNPTGMGGLNAFEHCDIAVNGPRYSRPPIPVGNGGVPFFSAWPSIPNLAVGTPFPPQVGIREQTDRRDQPSNEGVLPVNGEGQLTILGPGAAPNSTRVMKGKITYTVPTDMLDLIRMRPFTPGEKPTSGGIGPGTPPANPPAVITEEEPVTTIIDAGLQLGLAYLGAQMNQQPVYVDSYGPQQQIDPSTGGTMTTVTPAAVCPPNTSKGMVFDPNANCGVGKWIKRRRRRRQRLATASDIKDLVALQGAMPPKDLKAWIATHS